MTVKVGINGFGRIGRQVLKAVRDYHPDELEVVAFNDIGDLKTMAHLLKYDSNYGKFDGTVEVDDGELLVDGKPIKVFKETDPANIPWGSLGVEIVVESTGIFTIKSDGVNKKREDGKRSREPHHQGRRKESYHLRPSRGRGPDGGSGRQRPDVRSPKTQRRLQCFLHDQRSGARGEGR
ncbi:MAG: glyceraldehyde 3-phosphate dehydrogenase N-terminal domain-containing protein [Anaerolineales bacterium]|nr:glyceraldehyde 3-phosphate dehydrogenase N-terminal domain-containing protein [Anaerolineales bacterium]